MKKVSFLAIVVFCLEIQSGEFFSGYVNNMIESGKVEKAALLGINGSIWASSPDFITAEEAAKIAKAMGDSSGTVIQANGITINGVTYFTLRFLPEEGLFYGKKGATGVCIAKSTQTYVLGVYGEGMAAGEANVCVEGMKDYLVGAGY